MKSIIFIGHEASLTGAPFTQLYLIRWIKENTSYKVFLVLLNGGPLEQEFHKVADEVYIMWGDNQQNILPVRIAFKSSFLMSRRREVLLQRIKRFNPALIFANTALTIDFAAQLKKDLHIKLIVNIHELDSTFYHFAPERFENSVSSVDKFIMGSQMVKEYYQKWCNLGDNQVEVVYDFINDKLSGASNANSIRTRLEIPENSKVVGSIAVLYPRKGADVFVNIAKTVLETELDTYFVWVGGSISSPEYKAIQRDITLLGLEKRVLFVGEQRDLRGYYDLFDIFLLPSREDPFPLVCLESALAGNPIICFEKAGGMPEFVRNDAGIVIPYLDDKKMADATVYLLKNPTVLNQLGIRAQERVVTEHTIQIIGPKMYKIIEEVLA